MYLPFIFSSLIFTRPIPVSYFLLQALWFNHTHTKKDLWTLWSLILLDQVSKCLQSSFSVIQRSLELSREPCCSPSENIFWKILNILQSRTTSTQQILQSQAYLINSSCASSWLAWNIGFLVKSSPRIHLMEKIPIISKWYGFYLTRYSSKLNQSIDLSYPQLHTSIAGVYRSSPNSSSGGRYHKVMTLLVYGRLKKKKKKQNKKRQHTNSLDSVSVTIKEILLGDIRLVAQKKPKILTKIIFICLLNTNR